MDWRNFPPLSSLRAFAAFCETGSVQKAGDALGVSHAAISQQIRNLEAHMGLSLVDRSSRALELTVEGRQLADALAEGFGAMDRTIAALTGADANRPVHISTTQIFATTWLMPRLLDFQARHPSIGLMVNPSTTLVDPSPGGFDLALRFGSGNWPGLDVEMLVPTDVVITAAPSLVADRVIAKPADLLDLPWLQEPETNDLMDWMRKHGLSDASVKSTLYLPGNLMLAGAVAGQGVISTAMSSVEAEVRAGRLQILFRDKGDTGYHIVTHPGVMRPAAKAFLNWLRKQKENG